jgi:hypothetical protein
MADVAKMLQLPYGQRRLLVVADDDVIRAQDKALEEAYSRELGGQLAKRSEPDPVRNVAKYAVTATALSRLLGVGIAGPIGAIVVSAATELYSARQKMKERGFDVITISRTASQQLQFPIGHPRDRVLYVGHPAAPTSYIPMGDFHRFLFEHKVAEAFRLLSALGANELEVEHVTGWESLAAADFSVLVPTDEIEAGVKAGKERRTGKRILFKATLQSNKKPELPQDLIWFPNEPLWQSVAKARLGAGTEDIHACSSIRRRFRS